MHIAIASGKGGTGKTTVAANLTALLHARGHDVAALDCDVEEPNLHLYLSPAWERCDQVSVPCPEVDGEKCMGSSCGLCAELCRFKALAVMADTVLTFSEMCHGCGLCALACPAGAIREGARPVGVVRRGDAGGLPVVGGELRVGEAMSPPLIGAVLGATPAADLVITDCPPGTSCPMVKAVERADYAVLVTEPTPFGLHDLGLAAQTLRTLNLPFGAVINRDDAGGAEARRFLNRHGIPLLGALPHSLRAANLSSEGRLHVDALPAFGALYSEIWDTIRTTMGATV